jgi:hypothetical protein
MYLFSVEATVGRSSHDPGSKPRKSVHLRRDSNRHAQVHERRQNQSWSHALRRGLELVQ